MWRDIVTLMRILAARRPRQKIAIAAAGHVIIGFAWHEAESKRKSHYFH